MHPTLRRVAYAKTAKGCGRLWPAQAPGVVLSTGADEKLTQLTSSRWFDVGRGSATAYDKHQQWLSRRVETIDFVGARSVKRSISVDFEVPAGLPRLKELAAPGTWLVPISVFQKWPRLMGFNFVGPTGHPTSLYLRKTNKQLDFGLLLGMVDLTLSHCESALERHRRELRDTLGRGLGRPRAEQLPVELRRKLAAIVQSARPARAAIEDAVNELELHLRTRLSHALANAARPERERTAARITATVDLAGRLAASSVLWVNVDGDPGTDRIVKFSYLHAYHLSATPDDDEDEDREIGASRWSRWTRQILIACSWRKRTLFIPLPHAGRHVRFHLDTRAPSEGLALVGADVMAFPSAQAAGRDDEGVVRSVDHLAEKYDELDRPDEWVGPESSRLYIDYGAPVVLASASRSRDREMKSRDGADREATAEIVDDRAHVYLGERSAPSHRVFLQVKLAAARHGFITGCALAAFIIALLMGAGYFELESAALHLEPTVVLLSVVPVVLGYVLVRPGEHALEHYHIRGVRILALVSGATPIAGALTLVLTHVRDKEHLPNVSVARPIWGALAIVATIAAVALFFSWLRSARPSKVHEGITPDSRL